MSRLPVATADPEVSVIVPFHDALPYLAAAVESVLAQSHSDWELILVDDASGDGSRELAASRAAEHPGRIRLIDHGATQPRGAGPSRDLGVAVARGRWIAFLDADDRWLPAKLATQLDGLNVRPAAAMACGPSLKWYSWLGAAAPQADRAYDLSPVAGRLHEAGALLAAFVTGEVPPPCPSSWIVRRAAYLAAGGGEPAFARGPHEVYEDQALLTKLHLGCPLWIHPEVLDWYRKRDGSVYERAKRDGILPAARRAYLEWLVAYLERQGGAPTAAAAARRELADG